jgi:hypothetical protein
MAEAAPTTSEHEVLTFLSALYGRSAPGYLTFWRRQDRQTLWVPARDLEQSANLVVSSAETMDVYVGMGLRREARGAYERGKLDDVIGIPSLWDDLDLHGPAHKKQRLPTTREEALALLAELPVAPSVVVDSGWGIQPHWLLDHLWIFTDAGERRAAGALVRRFQAMIHERATAHGWTLDSTHDLTRVLRIPGTLNHKLVPVPVRLLAMDAERRYSPHDLDRILPPLTVGTLVAKAVAPVDLPPTLPIVDLDVLAISAHTRDVIRRGRGADPDRYPSRSEAAWRVLLDLIEAGCGDADIAAIFLDPAHGVGEKAREQGRRWLAGEIARARKAVRETPRLVIHVSDRPVGLSAGPCQQTVSDLSEGAARVLVDVA